MVLNFSKCIIRYHNRLHSQTCTYQKNTLSKLTMNLGPTYRFVSKNILGQFTSVCNRSIGINNCVFKTVHSNNSHFNKDLNIAKQNDTQVDATNSCFKHLTNLSETDTITSSDLSIIKQTETGSLEPCEEDVSDFAPFLMPSYNLAAYANNSYTLQQLIQMGVNLEEIENKKGAGELILKLDFEKDIKMHLRFLHDHGLAAEDFGDFITKNPFIFEQSLDDLEVRINYLEAKQFSKDMISSILRRCPFWLNYSTISIDKRLGFYQRVFKLSGNETRLVAWKQPRLITRTHLDNILESVFAVKELMGFGEAGARTLIVKKPKIFLNPLKDLTERFDYIHNIMEISHEQILQQPHILTYRLHITKQRHEFLKALGKIQFDPKLPGYISLDSLCVGSDVEFCSNVAKCSIDVFNAFLKTM